MGKNFSSVFYGIVLALATLLYAEFMAASFGLYEGDIKSKLLIEAMEHTEGITIAGHDKEDDIDRKVFKNEKDAKKIAKKAWVYMKRAHYHAEGLGAITLVLILCIAQSCLIPSLKKTLSTMIGAGGFIYPLCLLYAGIWMVDKGKLIAKKEIHYLAMSGVSLYLIGLTTFFALIIMCHFKWFPKLELFEKE